MCAVECKRFLSPFLDNLVTPRQIRSPQFTDKLALVWVDPVSREALYGTRRAQRFPRLVHSTLYSVSHRIGRETTGSEPTVETRMFL
ncbi:hypothetical protein RRG08_043758 [Elysia crispata]|uniref:Uncharacterized protein n=1 Tax=Elysia crispata TaxID=231223 RepID=A0AAE1DKA8_9GAST|nr:hypothetical protein RRG08_043758 [Elysia crispata]